MKQLGKTITALFLLSSALMVLAVLFDAAL